MPPLTLRTTFGTYTTGRQLGEGGAGRVYQATDESGQPLAVKILHFRKALPSKLKRFKNEIQFGLRNEHANLITIKDHGVLIQGRTSSPFYVMPLYSKTLRTLINEGLAAERVLPYFGQILDGIEAAHLLSVVHRDLKPENILFDPQADLLVVADFGIAHFEEEDLHTAIETSDKERLANFQYAAPEQRRRGQPVDHRADIFAAGLLLNEMYTREVPQGSNFRKIGSVSSEHGYLDLIVDRMIQQSPGDRPGSISTVKQELVAHKNEFITQQRLSQLRKTVIPETEIDDPLIADPMRVIGFDYQPGVLTFRLNHNVNDLWRYAFRNFGSHSAVFGKGPEQFVLQGNEARISARENSAQDILKHFKDWLPLVHRTYADLVREKQRDDINRRRRDLQLRQEAEEERLRVLGKLRL